MASLPPMRSRRVPRLADYDYSQAGMYFVTIVTVQRLCIFGHIKDHTMQYNAYGQIVAEQWLALPTHFHAVEVCDFVVMPNHFHGIVMLSENDPKAGQASQTPTQESSIVKVSLSTIIGALKSAITRQINLQRETPGVTIWQRSFHDRIIRNEAELTAIQEYIASNPLKWSLDRENPAI